MLCLLRHRGAAATPPTGGATTDALLASPKMTEPRVDFFPAPPADAETRRCVRPFKYIYNTPSRKLCCEANSVHAADLASWFSVEALVQKVEADVATVTIRLLFWDTGRLPSSIGAWKPLRWGDLGEMHGRRLHASAVALDLSAAWHVHPSDSTSDAATWITVQLRLPMREGDEAALQIHLLLNFGVRADVGNVDMCVSESSVHQDPGRGREMLVEGMALSQELTLRQASGSARLPPQRDTGAGRALLPLPLEGRGQDEVAEHRAITRALEAACADGGACWRVRLSAGPLTPAFSALQGRVAQHPLDGLLYAAAGQEFNVGEAVPISVGALEAPACVGLNLFVRRPDGTPAAGDLHTYLTMGAHAIIARAVCRPEARTQSCEISACCLRVGPRGGTGGGGDVARALLRASGLRQDGARHERQHRVLRGDAGDGRRRCLRAQHAVWPLAGRRVGGGAAGPLRCVRDGQGGYRAGGLGPGAPRARFLPASRARAKHRRASTAQAAPAAPTSPAPPPPASTAAPAPTAPTTAAASVSTTATAVAAFTSSAVAAVSVAALGPACRAGRRPTVATPSALVRPIAASTAVKPTTAAPTVAPAAVGAPAVASPA